MQNERTGKSSKIEMGPPPEYSNYSNPNDEPNGKDKNKTNCNLDGPYPGKQYLYPDVAKYPGNENQGTQGQPLMTTGVTQPEAVPSVSSHKSMVGAAILSCLCCFWPTGIFAIVAACKAENAAARGDAIEVTVQSRLARRLVIISVLVGLICVALAIIEIFLL
ncbi:proline-rich transmembrane protein 1-like [Crassostrea angulata]|uniref:proline-rich transmembrane protein 1-like n=1 Tax=Magallana angulata TaxID=2784310 RepID=UPI0022B089CF|nr:proline-rich transmembrane protein 1-like [Crassostrea angulata]XP_052707740.1 proline-rich transmembrane protein 1-like [Crassostrea angulata]